MVTFEVRLFWGFDFWMGFRYWIVRVGLGTMLLCMPRSLNGSPCSSRKVSHEWSCT